MGLFTFCLREREGKYSILNNNRFIHLFLSGKSINIQFMMIIHLFTPYLRGEEYKYLIYNNKEFIHLLSKKKRV